MASTSFPRSQHSELVCVLLWLLFRPCLQAALSGMANIVCPANCNQHGDCRLMHDRSVVACHCHRGWGGNSCQLKCTKPCSNGTCFFAGNKQLCLCSPGYSGELCSRPGYDMKGLLHLAKIMTGTDLQLPLLRNPQQIVQANIDSGSSTCGDNFVCRNGGVCVNGEMGGYRCECLTNQFTGNFCQNRCPKPCLNGGTCVRLRKAGSSNQTGNTLSLPESQVAYGCACPEGFSGELCDKRRGSAVLGITISPSEQPFASK
ncbi:hypothetical protein RRG08_009805 [Elysia crispata]|uniref:EGF-like domain-containing protein n=1 Tax=Elysia crispata TaxID=231223 RepID=A0AAE0XZP6_9GAST|nr:hypothetical protein RRG08_009805 [Elysia crispata]